jgi:peptidoglycan/LPS O-acetylase OafA/YrhL
MRPDTYRPEIDGLRALAVLSVLFYHAGFSAFGGGYVGVDVFFVISGYLITRLILAELERTGSFDFARFYVRRMRRLFPALLTTVAGSALFAFLLLSPVQNELFAESAIAALAGFSNFIFWDKADYFDALENTKPLLHTWSLGVEEQFYLLWPAAASFLFLRVGRRVMVPALIVVCLFSLAIGQYWMHEDENAAFYLLPSRMIELAIGALLVWAERYRPRSAVICELLAAAGLAMIAYAIFNFDHRTPFPGFHALLPCIGAALFIYAAASQLIGGVFKLRLVVWFGRISYSLYLVHWPVIVFFSAWTYRDPMLAEKWLIVVGSIALGWLQFRLVEERFRYTPSRPFRSRRFVGAALAAAALAIVPLGYVHSSGGVPWRIPEHRRVLSNHEWLAREQTLYCENWHEGHDRELFTCQNFRGKAKDLYIWGDSHALHLVAGISEAYPEHNIYVLYSTGCVPQSGFGGYVQPISGNQDQQCVARNRKALAFFRSNPGRTVILTSAKRSKPEIIAHATAEVIDALATADTDVAVLGDFIRPGISLADCVNVPDFIVTDEAIATRCTGREKAARHELKYNSALAGLIPGLIVPDGIQCPEKTCQFLHDGRPIFRDHHHLNVPGSIYLVSRLKPAMPF